MLLSNHHFFVAGLNCLNIMSSKIHIPYRLEYLLSQKISFGSSNETQLLAFWDFFAIWLQTEHTFCTLEE